MNIAGSILVVDDEQETCANLQDILVDLGYAVDVAFDGPSALRLVEQQRYDVALLDLKMPGMDGLELYRRIRQMRSGTVAVIVTAYATTDTTDSALQAGAWRVLPKPIDFPQILQLVAEAMEQPLIMIVDDDRDLCDSLWDLLRDRGYRVCLAHDLQAAAWRLADNSHGVVLIDMKLPDGEGTTLMEQVRQSNPRAQTILITGFRGEMEDRIQGALADGAHAVCYKPFEVEKLLETVKQLSSNGGR